MTTSLINTLDDLAKVLGTSVKNITYVVHVLIPKNMAYDTFFIPKKNGTPRRINAPKKRLKILQDKVAHYLSKYYHTKWNSLLNSSRNVSHAFTKKKGILSNASKHVGKKIILNVDLEDFFDSFHFGRVKGFFEKHKDFMFSDTAARYMSNMLCCDGVLPQGSPASPVLTNIMTQSMDQRILLLAKKYRISYTRYADDITFSTNRLSFASEQSIIMLELENIVSKEGFRINHKKTRLNTNNTKQKVTGLIVNSKINVDTRYYNQLRGQLHSFYQKGYYFIDDVSSTSVNHLEGKLSFIDQTSKFNNILTKSNMPNARRNLNKREREYQKFLFYKYLFAHKKPTIITEGKTDILYLKSALKNMYNKYPRLVKKLTNGTFEFHISFLNKTKRLSYFFNLNEGGDSMINLSSFLTVDSPYIKYFKELSPSYQIKPIILLYDNELESKDKPLKKVINKNSSSSYSNDIRKNLYFKLNDTDNLYIMTHKLTKESESEIEDLFKNETLNHQIEGKIFHRNSSTFNNKKHYSKDKFSKYIAKNYAFIDFSDFRELLDLINKVSFA